MPRKTKYSKETKVTIVKRYLAGESPSTLAREFGMGKSGDREIRRWSYKFKAQRESAFESRKHNASYSAEFKTSCVELYLSGQYSTEEICLLKGIPARCTLVNWIRKYSNLQVLEDYDPKPEVYMAKRRQTTLEERREAVQWYFDHGESYKETAAHFGYQYAAVRDWVIKYRSSGEDGLADRRGKRKDSEELSEIDRLRRENERLRKLLEYKEMETTLLKKAKEAERGWDLKFRK